MNNEKKTNEVQDYLKRIWRKPSEEPEMAGQGTISVLLVDKWYNISSYQMHDDEDWKDIVEEENVISWTMVSDITPTCTPNLKDYKTIRSYEDACKALGEEVDVEALEKAGVPKHIIAQMKLELICKALWGGEVKVYPDPDGNRIYWYPWFALYNQNEIDNMNDKQRGCLLSATAGTGAIAGFGCLGALSRSSHSSAYSGFRLCLDTEEKAEYFGKQFLELWAEAIAFNFSVGERLK